MEKEREFLITKYAPENPFDINSQNKNFLKFEWTLFINLKVLEKLQKLVKQDGAKLIFVDAISDQKKMESFHPCYYQRYLKNFVMLMGFIIFLWFLWEID